MKARNVVQLFVLIAVACFHHVCHCINPYEYSVQIAEAYGELNDFLASHSTGDARKWLEIARSELDRLDSDETLKNTGRRVVFAGLVALGDLLDNIQCDEDEHAKIEAMVSLGHTYVPRSELARLSPVDFIAHQVSLERAEKCKDVWPIKYMEAYRNYEDQSTLKLIEYKADAFEKKRRQFENNDREYIKYLLDYKSAVDPKRTEDACAHVIRHSKNDPNRCRFKEMYEKYLQMPCYTFTRNLDRPYLFQARYDLRMYPHEDDGHHGGFDLNKSEYIPFYEGLAREEACNSIKFDRFRDEVEEYWLKLLRSGLVIGCNLF